MSLKGNTTMRFIASLALLLLLAFTAPLPAQPPAQIWVVSWIGSVHGPYPSGNPSAQPDMKLAFPSAEAGARDQSFRMIVKPEIWGKEARLRLSNALGIRPVTFDGIYVGMQFGSSAVVSGTSRSVTFDGKRSVTIAPGASITDGTNSSLNGDDRWPDVLARRLRAVLGNRVSVVNAGIGGNQVVGPKDYSPLMPYPGGPSAGARLERDVLSLSGVSTVIWLEGINDFSRNGNATVEAVQAAMKEGVERIRARMPGVRVIGATLTPALGATNAAHGFAEQDEKRKALNEFIRASGVFDGVADFDSATRDPATGGLKPEFVHNTTTGGDGDRLHPNRLGYIAMGMAVDLNMMRPLAAKAAP